MLSGGVMQRLSLFPKARAEKPTVAHALGSLDSKSLRAAFLREIVDQNISFVLEDVSSDPVHNIPKLHRKPCDIRRLSSCLGVKKEPEEGRAGGKAIFMRNLLGWLRLLEVN